MVVKGSEVILLIELSVLSPPHFHYLSPSPQVSICSGLKSNGGERLRAAFSLLWALVWLYLICGIKKQKWELRKTHTALSPRCLPRQVKVSLSETAPFLNSSDLKSLKKHRNKSPWDLLTLLLSIFNKMQHHMLGWYHLIPRSSIFSQQIYLHQHVV